MVDRWKKGSEAVQQQLTLLGIKKIDPMFSGSGSFAYSHLHTPIKNLRIWYITRKSRGIPEQQIIPDAIFFLTTQRKTALQKFRLGSMFCSILIIV